MNAMADQLASEVYAAGYDLLSIEQLRHNRWLLVLRTHAGDQILVLAQRRPLILAADVQDLAEILQLRRFALGYLLALDGRFSPEALRTAGELRVPRIQLCAAIPPATPVPAPVNGALETA